MILVRSGGDNLRPTDAPQASDTSTAHENLERGAHVSRHAWQMNAWCARTGKIMQNTRRPVMTSGSWIERRRMLRTFGAGVLALATAPLLTACPQASEQSRVIQITGRNVFAPAGLTVARGSTVVWQNSGTDPQTVTCDPAKARQGVTVQLPSDASPWDSGDLYAGEVWRHTFTTPGTYTYFSLYGKNSQAVGTIIVQA